MTRFTSALALGAMVALAAVSSVTAHGYLSSPPPRGIEKERTNVDSLKAPNFSGGLCRGEPAGKVTNVGRSVTLGFTITAPHIGMCEVYILDENLSNPRKIAEKLDCAAPGKVGPWTVNIPSDVSGRKVLRWVWNAAHLGTTIEPYEQCVDINVNGGGAAAASAPESAPSTPAAPAPASPGSAPATPAAAPATNSGNGACTSGQYTCNGNKLGQCQYGSFVWTECAAGTTCHQEDDYAHCA